MKKLSLLLLAVIAIGCGGGGGVASSNSDPNSAQQSSTPPAVTTLAASSITPTSAILNGTAIPNGLPSQSWFEYGADSSLATYASSPRQDAGDALISQAANTTWNGLAPGTTYYFRFCAENSAGNFKGQIVSFTTSSPGSMPTVATLSAASVGAAEATLNGNVAPNGWATTAWFEWGIDPLMSSYTRTTTQSLGSGVISQVASIPLTGLSIGTTYYYRVAANNSLGTSKGSITSFTPGAVPSVTTLAATPVGTTTATLNGSVTANGLPTTAWFEWGIDPLMSSYTDTATQSSGSGVISQVGSIPLTGLSTGTTYYYRIAASNSSGTGKGSVLSFVPGAAPTVTTLAATSVGATTATLNGSVTANGLATNAWFEYGMDPALASSTDTSPQPVGSGTTSQSINVPLTGLSIGTMYYYRVAAGNGSGTTKGSVTSFTPGAVPDVTTLPATSVGGTTATLNGSVTANGLATDAWFEYGTDPTLASSTSASSQSVGSDTTGRSINVSLTGLTEGTTYYYRVNATNSAGTSTGKILGFTCKSHKITDWPNNKKGAISLTFDDACSSQLTVGLPALDARGMKGTFFVVTDCVAVWNPWVNASITGHEIASHTMSHPHLPTLSLTQVQDEMGGAKALIDTKITPQKCLTFAYPYGEQNSNIQAIARNNYISARGVVCGINQEPYDFYNVRACSPDDSDDIYGYADLAETQGKWGVVFFHSLTGGTDCFGVYTSSLFSAYLDYLKTRNLWVGTYGTIVKYIKEKSSAVLSVLSSSSNRIVLTLTDSLDDAIYDQPLTIRSEVPSGWNDVTVQQGSSSTVVQSHVEGPTRVIIYNAVPDRGLITLSGPGGG